MVREYTLYDLNPIKFTETCFMAQHVIYLGEYTVCTSKECIFYICCVYCSININYIKVANSVIQIFCGFAEFFCLVVLWIAGRGVLCVQYYNCGIIYFFLLFYQFLLHVVWGCIIKGIHIYNAYVFLMNCAIYPYDISLFISGNILVLKSILYNT